MTTKCKILYTKSTYSKNRYRIKKGRSVSEEKKESCFQNDEDITKYQICKCKMLNKKSTNSKNRSIQDLKRYVGF